ncbi:unnamed protein product [Rotaria sp. Silwood1]|nr:unnamed protein product [Rotaria sp. Silwood1]CAF0742246.1 unnamed protein product [Rotaria sp. Silwood1]
MLTVFKLLELAFAYKWTYTRRMPLKLLALYLLALPRMPESEAKLAGLSKQYVRREGILLILRSIFQCIIFRILLYLIPLEWLSLSSSSFFPIFRFLRYVLLSVLLYLSIDGATGQVHNFYKFARNQGNTINEVYNYGQECIIIDMILSLSNGRPTIKSILPSYEN